MASKRKAFLSRSVSLSLAALIVLTGAMFLITTLEQDHQEWKLVEDQLFDIKGLTSNTDNPASYVTEGFVFSFDEETATYTVEVPSDVSKGMSSKNNCYAFSILEDIDYSKSYKISIDSGVALTSFFLISNTISSNSINLKSVQAVDSVYHADVIMLDQYMTDLSFKDEVDVLVSESSASSYFAENTLTFQVYELHDDNAGSVAAAITGLTLIVMGVFATPMLNVFRRR